MSGLLPGLGPRWIRAVLLLGLLALVPGLHGMAMGWHPVLRGVNDAGGEFLPSSAMPPGQPIGFSSPRTMQHVSDNEIPDYISEIAEAELAMAQAQSPFDDDDGSDSDLGEETYDDSLRLTDEPEPEPVNPFDVVDDDDDEDIFGDQDDLDEADDDD